MPDTATLIALGILGIFGVLVLADRESRTIIGVLILIAFLWGGG
jgi:hypothetical protein